MILNDVKELKIEDFLKIPAIENYTTIFSIIENTQEYLVSLKNLDDSELLIKLKTGTIITLSILKKLSNGMRIQEFTASDWNDIVNNLNHYVVDMEAREYSAFVFSHYADYIESSIQILPDWADVQKVDSIYQIVDELRNYTDTYLNNEVYETTYIENCLWLSLEAMIKLFSICIGSFTGQRVADIIYASSLFTFEYSRLILFEQEQSILTEYLQHQFEVDSALQEKFDLFKMELEKNQTMMNQLIENAFTVDIKDALKNSAELARQFGVREAEILDSIDKIDDFFLG